MGQWYEEYKIWTIVPAIMPNKTGDPTPVTFTRFSLDRQHITGDVPYRTGDPTPVTVKLSNAFDESCNLKLTPCTTAEAEQGHKDEYAKYKSFCDPPETYGL